MGRDVGFADLHLQMRITNMLLAEQLRTRKTQAQLIELIATSGATVREIADIMGTTPATVQVALSRSRKRSGKPRSGGEQKLLPGY